MPDKLYALTDDDVTLLKQLVAAWRRGDLGRPLQQSPRPLPERNSVLFGVVNAAVNGTSAALSDPPSGTLNVYKFTTTGGTTDTGLDETVYNLSTVSRTTDEFTLAVRDYESGKWCAVAGGGASSGYKPTCRFTLDAALTQSDGSAAALLTDQYGEGSAHSTGAITVLNTLSGYTTGYIFEGSSGTAGIATYDSSTSWLIIQLFRVCT